MPVERCHQCRVGVRPRRCCGCIQPVHRFGTYALPALNALCALLGGRAWEDPRYRTNGVEMSLVALMPIMVVLVVIGSDVWVYADSRTRAQQGDPVVLSVGSRQLDSPELWLVACLVLWVFTFPLDLASRSHPS